MTKRTIIFSDESELLKKFILTVGVVSNHGNWFTAENHNKELKVLAQSYDWLIFLTDKQKDIEKWFNIIAPEGKTITELKNELTELRSKNWEEIL